MPGKRPCVRKRPFGSKLETGGGPASARVRPGLQSPRSANIRPIPRRTRALSYIVAQDSSTPSFSSQGSSVLPGVQQSRPPTRLRQLARWRRPAALLLLLVVTVVVVVLDF